MWLAAGGPAQHATKQWPWPMQPATSRCFLLSSLLGHELLLVHGIDDALLDPESIKLMAFYNMFLITISPSQSN